jgi:hypothetical protein
MVSGGQDAEQRQRTGAFAVAGWDRRAPTVKVASGADFPEKVTVYRPYKGLGLQLDIEVRGGRPVTTCLYIAEEQVPVTATRVDDLPLARITDELMAAIAGAIIRLGPVGKGLDDPPVPVSDDPTRLDIPLLRSDLAVGRNAVVGRRGRRVPEETLQKVAEIVQDMDDAAFRAWGGGWQEVASALNVSHRTATRMIDRARRRGFLRR